MWSTDKAINGLGTDWSLDLIEANLFSYIN